MINFFRKIRRQLANENKFQKYFRYAFGEILLVVIGILIALQVNNWNEQRKQNIVFNFSLKQFHEQLYIDLYMLEPIRDGYNFQLYMIDSLLNHPNLLEDQKLPLIIESLDFKEIQNFKQRLDVDFRRSLVKFNPDNEDQNRLAQLLSKNINFLKSYLIDDNDKNEQTVLNNELTFQKYLNTLNIPIKFFTAGLSYQEFYNQRESGGAFNPTYRFSDETISKLRESIGTEEFLSDLDSYHFRILAIFNLLFEIEIGTNKLIQTIEKLNPDIHLQFESLKIAGTGTSLNSWENDIEMQKMDDKGFVWELTTTLRDGAIKFRTDDLYTFNWGIGNLDTQSLCFDGNNIPTKKGNYIIKVNLKEHSFEFIKQD